jgi:Phosphofructokinase
MNAAIRAVTREALARGISVTGFSQGYAGVLEWKTIELTVRAVGGIIHHGGTMLGSVRCQEICYWLAIVILLPSSISERKGLGNADFFRQFTQRQVRTIPQLVKSLAQRNFDHVSAKKACSSVARPVESSKPLLKAKTEPFFWSKPRGGHQIEFKLVDVTQTS